jgi:hypothetical protein
LIQRLKNACQDTHAVSRKSRRQLSSICLLQGNASKEIPAILKEALGENIPSYATINNWVTKIKCGDFSTWVALVVDEPNNGNPGDN